MVENVFKFIVHIFLKCLLCTSAFLTDLYIHLLHIDLLMKNQLHGTESEILSIFCSIFIVSKQFDSKVVDLKKKSTFYVTKFSYDNFFFYLYTYILFLYIYVYKEVQSGLHVSKSYTGLIQTKTKPN
jgi:hypothetical protein